MLIGIAAETSREDDHDERDRKSGVKGAILVCAFLFAYFVKSRHIRHDDRHVIRATVLKGSVDQFIGAMLCIALPLRMIDSIALFEIMELKPSEQSSMRSPASTLSS